jgi:hypothetical protein
MPASNRGNFNITTAIAHSSGVIKKITLRINCLLHHVVCSPFLEDFRHLRHNKFVELKGIRENLRLRNLKFECPYVKLMSRLY